MSSRRLMEPDPDAPVMTTHEAILAVLWSVVLALALLLIAASLR